MKRTKFESLMDQAGELPTLPVVAQKVLNVIHEPRTGAGLLQELLELDPVLSAHILRLANSAYYRAAGAKEVADIRRAIVVLGFVTIRNVTLATCLRSLYRGEFRTSHFSARDLWVHSVGVAVVTRMLAGRVPAALPEEAFLAGLVHDVGMIVEWNLLPDRFPQVLQRYHGTGLDFRRAERETLGFDHCEAGAAMLRRWDMPAALRKVVAHHHDLRKVSRDDIILPSLVHLAEKICSDRGNGFFDHAHDVAETLALLEALGLVGDSYQVLMREAEEELSRAKELLSL